MRKYLVTGLALLASACAPGSDDPESGPLVVYTAGSLARPIRAALDSFTATTGVRWELESAGSLETARKLTELGKIPDLVALADEDVFPKLLLPAFTSWYVRFAENRIVLAYTDRSHFAAEVDSTNWYEVLQRPGIETGRSNPDLDPSGYRTLMVFQLAEQYYGRPGLAGELEAAAPPRNIRPKEIELVALLESGDLDYAWFYESMARASSMRFVRLPDALDLGTAGEAERYATAAVRVVGASVRDTVAMRGAPIRYAFSVPRSAPHAELGTRFAAFLLSPGGRVALEGEFLQALAGPDAVGDSVPATVTAALRAVAR
jgi:molybdate/tungstate transport system substrate-binding protein